MPNLRNSLAFILLILLSGCTGKMSVYNSYKAPTPTTATLINTSLLTNQNTGISVGWQVPSTMGPSDVAQFTVIDSQNNVISQTLVQGDSVSPGSIAQTVLNGTMPDGILQLQLVVVNQYALRSAASTETIQVDTHPPLVTLALGTDPLADPCQNTQPGRAKVGIKQVPFNLCAQDPSPGSGVIKLCLFANNIPSQPPALSDPCWQDPSVVFANPYLVLGGGGNTVAAFALDAAGNVGGSGTQNIELDIGLPPKVTFLSPSSYALAYGPFGPKGISKNALPWQPGDTVTFQWQVADQFTLPANIRFSVVLVQETDLSNYLALDCNFTDGPFISFCPPGATPSSSKISLSAGPDPHTGIFSYQFTVPSALSKGPWDKTKTYQLLAMAVDEAGNAGVGSHPPFNTGYEVLAGLSYHGLGGSGTAMVRSRSDSGFFTVDQAGQIYVPSSNFWIRNFDLRACPLAHSSSSQVTAVDCRPALIAPYNVNPYYWTYNPDDPSSHIFYVVESAGNQLEIIEIKFPRSSGIQAGTPTSRIIFGGQGTTALPSRPPFQLPANAVSTNYGGPIRLHLFYETSSKKLYFRTSSTIYSIDVADTSQPYALKYVLGSNSSSTPPAQTSVKQSDLELPDFPNNDLPWVVTTDHRIFIQGGRLQSEATTVGGGTQYVIDGFSDDPSTKVNLIQLTPNTPTVDPSNATFYIQSSLAYDPKANRIFSNRIAEMDLPSTGSGAGAYLWNLLLNGYSSVLESTYLASPPANPTYPLSFICSPSFVAYAGNDILYFINALTGDILSIYLPTKQVALEVGSAVGADGDELGIDRQLQTPWQIFADNKGQLVFNDFYSLQRLSSPSSSNQSPQISTLASRFPNQFFTFDPKHNALYITNSNSLTQYSYQDSGSSSTAVQNPSTLQVSPSISGGSGRRGISYNFNHPKTSAILATRDSAGDVIKTSLVLNDFITLGQTVLSDFDQYALGAPECPQANGTDQCTQGSEGANNYYNSSTFRMAPASDDALASVAVNGNSNWNCSYKNPNDPSDVSDDCVFVCEGGNFYKFKISKQEVFPFSAMLNGTAIGCQDGSTYFSSQPFIAYGDLYVTWGNQIYKIDASQVESNNTATLTQVVTDYPMLQGFYGGFYFYTAPDNNTYVAYVDQKTNRVLRNLILP